MRVQMAGAIGLVAAAGLLGACLPPRGTPPVIRPALVITSQVHERGLECETDSEDRSLLDCQALLLSTITNQGDGMTVPGVAVTTTVGSPGGAVFGDGNPEPDACDADTLLAPGESCSWRSFLYRLVPFADVITTSPVIAGTLRAASSASTVSAPFAVGPIRLTVVAEATGPAGPCTVTGSSRECPVPVRLTVSGPAGVDLSGLELGALAPHRLLNGRTGGCADTVPLGSSCTSDHTVTVVDAAPFDGTASITVFARSGGLALVGSAPITVTLPTTP